MTRIIQKLRKTETQSSDIEILKDIQKIKITMNDRFMDLNKMKVCSRNLKL